MITHKPEVRGPYGLVSQIAFVPQPGAQCFQLGAIVVEAVA
jgi:hypothetical protein